MKAKNKALILPFLNELYASFRIRIVDGEKLLFMEELQLIIKKGMIKLSVDHLATPNGSSQWSSIIVYIKRRAVTKYYVPPNGHTHTHF